MSASVRGHAGVMTRSVAQSGSGQKSHFRHNWPAMDTNAVVSILGVWAGGKGSLHRQLTGALMDAVRQGGLAPGVRLPSERTLAKALKISRTTVVAAYDALREAGWLESRHGSGTWVRTGSQPVATARSAARLAALSASPVLGLIVSPEADDVVDLGLGSPLALTAHNAQLCVLPSDEYATPMHERSHFPLGLPLLRQAIADRY